MRSQESLYGVLIGLFLVGLVFVISSIYYYTYNPKYIKVHENVFSLADLGNYLRAMIGVKTAESAREASSIVLSKGFGMSFSCPCSNYVSCPTAKKEYESEFVGIMSDFISMLQIFSKTNGFFYPYNVSFNIIGSGLKGGVTQSCEEILSGGADEGFTVYLKNLTISVQKAGNIYKIVAPAGADILHNRMWFLYRKVRGWILNGGSSCLIDDGDICDPNICAHELQEYINDPYVKCKGVLVKDYRSASNECGVQDNHCCSNNGYKVCTVAVICNDTKYYQYINGKNIPLSIIVRGTLYASKNKYYDTCVKNYHCTCINGTITRCVLVNHYVQKCTCETEDNCPAIGASCTHDIDCVKETCCTKTCCCYCSCGSNCCEVCPTCCT